MHSLFLPQKQQKEADSWHDLNAQQLTQLSHRCHDVAIAIRRTLSVDHQQLYGTIQL